MVRAAEKEKDSKMRQPWYMRLFEDWLHEKLEAGHKPDPALYFAMRRDIMSTLVNKCR